MSDLIDRQAAIDAIAEALNPHLVKFVRAKNAIEQLPPAQPDVPDINVGDMISRQAVKEILDKHQLPYHKYPYVWDAIDELPPAQPERTPMQELLDVTADRDYWKAQCHSYEMTINRLTESAQPEIIQCKDCKHFEYDHVENVNGIPLIVAHEICMRWGDGVKTSENGYCFLAERREVTT